MKVRRCDDVRQEISARMDGEAFDARALDDHLAECEACRAHESALASVRRTLRAQPVGRVPDLSRSILDRIREEGLGRRRRDEWNTRLRIGAVAAAVVALALLGTSLPWVDNPPQRAAASEITREVQGAARTLTSYRASFSITERGWNDAVPVRRFTAEIAYQAPESFRLLVRDRTAYPGSYAWPRNNVDLAAGARRWRIEEPMTCPTEALPGCPLPQATSTRSVVRRQPFDGITTLPTDIIVPLESIGGGSEFTVLGSSTALGRAVEHLRTSYRYAAPLVAALQAGGSWRRFGPSARVDLWVDAVTTFPLRFTVRPAAGGSPLLSVAATSFSRPSSLPRSTFRTEPASVTVDRGFSARRFSMVSPQLAPTYTASLEPYRAGVTNEGRRLLAYAHGMTWLRVIEEPYEAAQVGLDLTVEEVRLENGGTAYYAPATLALQESLRRRVDVYAPPSSRVRLESNLPRSELLKVAASLPVEGRRVSRREYRRDGLTFRRLAPSSSLPSFARSPESLPPGYEPTGALLTTTRTGTRTLTLAYRRAETDFDPAGIRITQSPGTDILPPSSEDMEPVALRGTTARWSRERSEVEWIERGVYRAVAAPSFSRAAVMRIAQGLR
ncbi:MAG: anti-sigma factor [Actinomycetota bacterium]|nr:anti-sigma factor [Actinomycetota bacterium]